jgi:DNA-directed RNA polymerase specialized sigma24 family protein
VTKQIAKKDLRAASQRFETQRARYLYLTKLGYSQAEIAGAFGISKRAVWQAIHAAAVPREKGKLERYRVRVPARRV